MMKTAEDRVGENLPSAMCLVKLNRAGTTLADALVRAGVIEVGLVLLHGSTEMAFVEDQDEVETLSPYTTQESFADGVCPGCSIGRGEDLDAGAARDLGKGSAELVVVVPNEEARALAEGGGFSQLLGAPGITGAPGHAERDEATRTEFNHHEEEEGAEEPG